jgi:hypothetical protein
MRRTCTNLAVLLCLAFAGSSSIAATITDAVIHAADHLVATQSAHGSWAGETDYTGPIVAGLLDAYSLTGNNAYKTAAQNGANFIIANSSHFLGDEAYALTRVSDVQANPNSNSYRTAAANFFNNTIAGAPGGTLGSINNLVSHYTTMFGDQSQPVIYLAYDTVASAKVSATDAAIWRTGLINTLEQVDDNDYFPVESLGAAVWALAQTGNGLSASTSLSGTFNGLTLADLPSLLMSEMMPAGPGAHSAYYDFAHTDGGYTEDTAMALMGLEAALNANPGLGYGSSILAGQLALTDAIDSSGNTSLDVFGTNPQMSLFAGRSLEALAPVAVPLPSSAPMGAAVLGLLLIARKLKRSAKFALARIPSSRETRS